MFGAHLSIAGGLENALIKARELDFECVQIFMKNQRQWSAKPLGDEEIASWREHVVSTGIRETVSHDSYLINLASADLKTREKSIRLFMDEIERCEALGILWLVSHPGAHVGLGETKGLRRVAKALDRVHRSLRGYRTITCLEITSGQGTTLGHRFEHLRSIIESVKEPDRLAVCFDTAHALAAGYDLTSADGARGVLQEFDDVIGLDRLRVFHLNDSMVERGRRVDRHEHIGRGHVALEAFRHIVTHRAFRDVPKILETPKGVDGKGRDWDRVNLARLRGLTEGGAKKRSRRKR